MRKIKSDYFIKLCEQIYTFDGEFHFPFGKFQLDDEYSYIIESDIYDDLTNKMDNYLKLLNSDIKYFDMEIEDVFSKFLI